MSVTFHLHIHTIRFVQAVMYKIAHIRFGDDEEISALLNGFG